MELYIFKQALELGNENLFSHERPLKEIKFHTWVPILNCSCTLNNLFNGGEAAFTLILHSPDKPAQISILPNLRFLLLLFFPLLGFMGSCLGSDLVDGNSTCPLRPRKSRNFQWTGIALLALQSSNCWNPKVRIFFGLSRSLATLWVYYKESVLRTVLAVHRGSAQYSLA